MAKLNVRVTDFVPDFIKLMRVSKPATMMINTTQALHTLAEAYAQTWRSYAYGALQVPGSKIIRSKGPYARSIQIDDTRPFSKEIFTDFYPHRYIELGHGEIDLKPGLLSGGSARMGKNGPYNIVSFRQDTPNVDAGQGNPMPVNIYNLMKGAMQEADAAKKAGLQSTGGSSTQKTSGVAGQRSYKWGARLDSKLQQGRRSQLYSGYTWKSGKYAGMVAMQQSTTKAKRHGYITFRIVSRNSDPRSWIVPPAPPIPIRQATVDFVAANMNVEEIIRDALEKDLAL